MSPITESRYLSKPDLLNCYGTYANAENYSQYGQRSLQYESVQNDTKDRGRVGNDNQVTNWHHGDSQDCTVTHAGGEHPIQVDQDPLFDTQMVFTSFLTYFIFRFLILIITSKKDK